MATKKELEVLFPRFVSGGILIVDDYDVWAGARKATQEFLTHHDGSKLAVFFNHSYGALIGVKVSD